jgi:hypothetical protein
MMKAAVMNYEKSLAFQLIIATIIIHRFSPGRG